jgi:hypothetical protein
MAGSRATPSLWIKMENMFCFEMHLKAVTGEKLALLDDG